MIRQRCIHLCGMLTDLITVQSCNLRSAAVRVVLGWCKGPHRQRTCTPYPCKFSLAAMAARGAARPVALEDRQEIWLTCAISRWEHCGRCRNMRTAQGRHQCTLGVRDRRALCTQFPCGHMAREGAQPQQRKKSFVPASAHAQALACGTDSRPAHPTQRFHIAFIKHASMNCLSKHMHLSRVHMQAHARVQQTLLHTAMKSVFPVRDKWCGRLSWAHAFNICAAPHARLQDSQTGFRTPQWHPAAACGPLCARSSNPPVGRTGRSLRWS